MKRAQKMVTKWAINAIEFPVIGYHDSEHVSNQREAEAKSKPIDVVHER